MIPHVLGAEPEHLHPGRLGDLDRLISKHGILMTEFANELQRKEGLDKRAAIQQAAVVRLRPS
jgi:multidrug efflux pump